jgi:hypothetical protein
MPQIYNNGTTVVVIIVNRYITAIGLDPPAHVNSARKFKKNGAFGIVEPLVTPPIKRGF